MSSYARWRHTKIVVPNREEELIGGIKNALERGEILAKAKQSFLNAGYNPTEIQAAIQKIPASVHQNSKSLNQQLPSQTAPIQKQQPASTAKTIIILSIVGLVILILAAVLGIFWDKIF